MGRRLSKQGKCQRVGIGRHKRIPIRLCVRDKRGADHSASTRLINEGRVCLHVTGEKVGGASPEYIRQASRAKGKDALNQGSWVIPIPLRNLFVPVLTGGFDKTLISCDFVTNDITNVITFNGIR